MAEQNDVVLKIINCVKQHPALYDTAHEDYNRYYKKIQIWNNIAAEVNYSDGKSAQTKWRNIRDSYVKHLKSLQTMEPAYRKYRNWQWVEQMSFLRKFLGGSRQKNAARLNGSAYDGAGTSMIDVVESVYGESSEQVNFQEINDSCFESPVTVQKRKSDSQLWFTNNSIIPEGCEAYYQKDYILENNGIDPNIDATDLLFLSYSKTLKMFSKKRQIQVKMKISELMGQAELEEDGDRTAESNHVDSSERDEYHYPRVKYPKIKRENELDVVNEAIFQLGDQVDSSNAEHDARVKRKKSTS